MVDGIGSGSASTRDALAAALAAHARAASAVESKVAGALGASSDTQRISQATNEFAARMSENLRDADHAARTIDALAPDLVRGKIQDFHEVAVAIKSSELTFKFALEVRNKLIEAYRETMRMNV